MTKQGAEKDEPGVHGRYDGQEARGRRHEALAAALDRFPRVQQRFEAAYGMRLPRHLAYAAAFFLGMSAQERQLSPASLFAFGEWFWWLAPGESERIATLDERLEGRFRRDVPELVTMASGHSDGSHWGLFYDVPSELPRLVAHGYARDDGAVWQAGTTLLGAIRPELTAEGLDAEDKPRMRALLGWLDALHAEERRAHEEEGIGAPHAERIDGGGAGLGPYLPGYRLPDGIPGANERLNALRDVTAEAQAWIDRARVELREGRGELALLLGRELHFLDMDVTREVAAELLAPAYEALGRPELAAVARVHHQHRDLTHVAIYRTAEQLAEPAPEFVMPPLVTAVQSGDAAQVARALAEAPSADDVTAALCVALPGANKAPSAEILAILGLLLDQGGSEAATAALDYALVRMIANVGPDLLDKGGRPRADQSRMVVEHLLARKDQTVVRLLLGRGARATSATSAEHAVKTGDADIFEQVARSAPADVDLRAHRADYLLLEDPARPSGGATLLHFAVCSASPEIVRALLDRGLDPGAKDDAGKTPRDLARALWMVQPRAGGAIMDLLGRPAEAAKAPAPRPEWEVGATAAHARFGEGIVKSVSGVGADAKVTVKFESGDKTLLAKFVTRVS